MTDQDSMHDHPMTDNAASVRSGASLLDALGHMCAFYRSHGEEYRVLLPSIKKGRERGEPTFHIVDSERREEQMRHENPFDVPPGEFLFELRERGPGRA